MIRPIALLSPLIPLAAACGSDDAGHGAHATADAAPADAATPSDTATDAAQAPDAPARDAPDAVTPLDATEDAAPVPTLNDCVAADYIDASGAEGDRVVRPRGSTGYTPRCLTIRAGQAVAFEMDFTAHPLVPGVPHGSTAGATSPNPIVRQTTGTMYTVTFASAGHYPFYCSLHGHVGMAGVVRVVP